MKMIINFKNEQNEPMRTGPPPVASSDELCGPAMNGRMA